jgi:hypothetical protein
METSKDATAIGINRAVSMGEDARRSIAETCKTFFPSCSAAEVDAPQSSICKIVNKHSAAIAKRGTVAKF